jgi:hypothetical protein
MLSNLSDHILSCCIYSLRFASLEQDLRLGKITQSAFMSQAFDVLSALEKLGEALEPREKEIIAQVSKNMSAYSEVTDEVSSARIMQTAKDATSKAK